MNERIKKVRKTLDLTQREFAERIGIKRNSVALIETGRNTSDQTIIAICREFNVREEWLRTGEGEMFVPEPTSELDALAARFPQMTRETYVLIEKLINLPAEKQAVISDFLREVVAGYGDTEIVSPQPAAEKHPRDMSPEEMHRALDDHLETEKDTETSRASTASA